MYYNLDIESQIVNIFEKFKLEDLKNSNNTNNLTDIRDGRLYKKILESNDGLAITNQEAFTFLLNTDGISSFQKSKLTIWPVFLVINELPLESRFLDVKIKLYFHVQKNLKLLGEYKIFIFYHKNRYFSKYQIVLILTTMRFEKFCIHNLRKF